MSKLRMVLLLIVLAAFAALNAFPANASIPGTEPVFAEEYGRAFGWPIRALQTATDRGRDLVHGSVTLEGTMVIDSRADRSHPHVVIAIDYLIVDVILLAVALWAVTRWGRKTRKREE